MGAGFLELKRECGKARTFLAHCRCSAVLSDLSPDFLSAASNGRREENCVWVGLVPRGCICSQLCQGLGAHQVGVVQAWSPPLGTLGHLREGCDPPPPSPCPRSFPLTGSQEHLPGGNWAQA